MNTENINVDRVSPVRLEISGGEGKAKEAEIKINTKVKSIVSCKNCEEQNKYHIDILDIQKLSLDQVKEISDLYRYIFNNAFPKYAMCADCNTWSSAKKIFKTSEYVELAKLDDECSLPDCEDCGDKMNFFHDPNTTLQKLTELFQKEGKILLLSSEIENPDEEESAIKTKIEGVTFGYYDSLENVTKTEWGHSHNYMDIKHQKEDQLFDVDGAIEKVIAYDKNLTAEVEVFCWNCIMLSPEVQGNMNVVVKDFLGSLSKTNCPVISQALPGSKSHTWLKRRGYEDIPDVFSKEYSFMLGDLEEVCYEYSKK